MKVLHSETAVRSFQVAGSLPVPQYDRLNLGCGRKHENEVLNLDCNPETQPDVVHDLNSLPWPFPNDHFREVMAYDCLEHLDNFISVMEEIHRICRDGAIVRISVPHFSCANAYTDPTHQRAFGYFSFDYLTGENGMDFYTRARFKRLSRRMFFFPSLINKLIWRLANRYPMVYELRWTWIFPAWYLYFELEVQK